MVARSAAGMHLYHAGELSRNALQRMSYAVHELVSSSLLACTLQMTFRVLMSMSYCDRDMLAAVTNLYATALGLPRSFYA